MSAFDAGLPVAVFRELLDPLLGGHAEFAVRVLAQEILVGLGGIGGLRGLPVLADTAAASRDTIVNAVSTAIRPI